jgi:(2Fe-2S) ferredoxin
MNYRKHILVCTTLKERHCGSKGGEELFQSFKKAVIDKGIRGVLVSRAGCTHQHHCGPTVIIHPDGVWYKEVKIDDIDEILDEHIMNGRIVERILNKDISVGVE